MDYRIQEPSYKPKKLEMAEKGISSNLEALLMTSETKLSTNSDSVLVSDCPCPCPAILTAGVYVTFSPIF